MNVCGACDLDFASVAAFDKHRVGKHEYLFAEGIEMTPPRKDGRRCLDVDEMLSAGLELDQRERWCIVGDPRRFDRLKDAA